MGNAQSAYLSVSHANDKARKKRAERLANSWGGKMQMKSPQMKRYMKKREEKLKKGADLRKAQEEDETKGERVWFSRCILNGRLQHWVLITHGMKYELGRENRDQPRTNSKEENYVLKIKEYAIDQEKRDASLTELLVPDTDGYYVCLVGWTRMNKNEVANAGREARAEFGEYSLLRNNCQDFLRQLADKILISDKAADYDWFRSNTKTKYQKDQWLLPPPAEMMLRMLENMQQMQMQHVR